MNEVATLDQGFRPWRAVCGVVGLIVALSVMALAQSSYPDTDPEANQVVSGGAFGYCDPEGKRVLVPVETALARGMGRFSKAVVAPGRVVNLRYAGAQRPGDGGIGRQTPERFDDTAGAVFDAAEPLGAGRDVLVTTDAFLASRQVLALTPLNYSNCSPELEAALSARSGRSVLWCKDLASLEDGGKLSVARFSRKGQQELVTLAYSGPDGSAYLDHPADVDPGGTWRVDDGGNFTVADYKPLFAFRTKAGLELAVRWSGAEGEAMNLYRQEGDAFAPFVAASWYRMEE